MTGTGTKLEMYKGNSDIKLKVRKKNGIEHSAYLESIGTTKSKMSCAEECLETTTTNLNCSEIENLLTKIKMVTLNSKEHRMLDPSIYWKIDDDDIDAETGKMKLSVQFGSDSVILITQISTINYFAEQLVLYFAKHHQKCAREFADRVVVLNDRIKTTSGELKCSLQQQLKLVKGLLALCNACVKLPSSSLSKHLTSSAIKGLSHDIVLRILLNPCLLTSSSEAESLYCPIGGYLNFLKLYFDNRLKNIYDEIESDGVLSNIKPSDLKLKLFKWLATLNMSKNAKDGNSSYASLMKNLSEERSKHVIDMQTRIENEKLSSIQSMNSTMNEEYFDAEAEIAQS